MTDSHESRRLGLRIVKGAAWTFSARMVIRLLGVISMIILARLLLPEDFGLVALATTFAAAIELLGEFNFEVWLIRHPNPKREHYDTVWTMTAIRGLLTGLVLVLLAYPAAGFFHEPRLSMVMVALAGVSILSGFSNIGVVDYQKHLEFGKDFTLMSSTKLASFITTVTLAIIFRSYWALVAGIVANKLFFLVISYAMNSYRPRFSLKCWREIFEFSKWLLVANILGFMYTRADTLILGRLMNARSLGLYTVARDISGLASTEIIAPIRRVMLPGYSKMIDDIGNLRSGFVNGFTIIVFLTLPLAVGVGITADPLVRSVLGEKWIEAIPLIQILAIHAAASIGLANQGSILIALDRTRLLAALYGIGVLLLLPTFYWFTQQFGLAGGVFALSGTNMAVLIISLLATTRALEIRFWDVVQPLTRTLMATVSMIATVLAIQLTNWSQDMPSLALLFLCAVCGATTYVAVALLAWRFVGCPEGPEKAVLSFVLARIRRQVEA